MIAEKGLPLFLLKMLSLKRILGLKKKKKSPPSRVCPEHSYNMSGTKTGGFLVRAVTEKAAPRQLLRGQENLRLINITCEVHLVASQALKFVTPAII